MGGRQMKNDGNKFPGSLRDIYSFGCEQRATTSVEGSAKLGSTKVQSNKEPALDLYGPDDISHFYHLFLRGVDELRIVVFFDLAVSLKMPKFDSLLRLVRERHQYNIGFSQVFCETIFMGTPGIVEMPLAEVQCC